LVNQHGFEAERHLYRCLFSSIDFSAANSGSGGYDRHSGIKDFLQIQLLTQEINSLFAKPNFVTLICYAIDHPFSTQKTLRPNQSLLPQISRTLKLTRAHEVTLGLALLFSLRQETRDAAQTWLQAKLPDLLRSYVDADTGSHDISVGGGIGIGTAGLQEMSIEMVHLILTKLREEQLATKRFGASPELVEAFLRVLRKDFPKQRVPVVLAPLLYSEAEDLPVSKTFREPSSLQQMVVSSNSALQNASQSDWALAELLEELGYSCIATADSARLIISEFGVRELSPSVVARCISMFLRSCDGQLIDRQIGLHGPGLAADVPAASAWCVENFLTAVRELCPGLQFRSVVAELDHDGFEVKSPRAFELLRVCLMKGFQGPTSDLPIEIFYRPWRNAQGQLSFLRHCLLYPEILCLGYWRFRQSELGRLKLNASLGAAGADDEARGAQMWRNLDLIDALLCLSEKGFYTEVRELLDQPIKACPELLMLSLLQSHDSTPTGMGILKQELLQLLTCLLLSNSQNVHSVLGHAWNYPPVRPVLLAALADWTVHNGSQDSDDKLELIRVAKALELIVNYLQSSNMEGLAMALKSSNYLFALSMACFAAKRDFLNLEVWINERLGECGDGFVQAAVKFLTTRAASLVAGEEAPLEVLQKPVAQYLDKAAVQTILRCLERRAPQPGSSLLPETTADVATLLLNFNRNLHGRSQTLPPHQIMQRQHSGGDHLTASNLMPPPPPPPPPPPSAFSKLPGPPPQSVVGGSFSSGLQTAFSSQMSNMPLSPVPSASMLKPGANPLAGLLPPQQLTPKHKLPPPSMSVMPPPIGSPHPGTGHPTPPPPHLAPPPGHMGMPPPPPPGPPGSAPSHYRSPMLGLAMPPELLAQPPSAELDERVNLIMKSLFSSAITSDEVFAVLRDPNEKQLCNYFLRVLADEFVHIPTSFPPKQRSIMAELFGHVIALRFQLASHSVLTYFLRLLNFCLTRPIETESDQTFFTFGLDILNKCKPSLSDYRQVASHLLSCSNFPKFPKDLQIAIQIAANGASNTEAGAGSLVTAGRSDDQQGRSGDSAPDSAVVEEPVSPPESVQDAVFFIFNNLSKINIVTKAEELLRAVPEDYIPWLGQYLVMKRVTTEPNFHQLYIDLMDALNVPKLKEVVLQQTFRSIRALLLNMRPDLNDYNDRALLKNIGRFLGLLTLAKNRPILYEDMNLKGLLLEAYCKGQVEMHYAVPFVSRTLEACNASTVFRPPNPWTMGIIRVLKELHMDKAVKNSLKFEVEILCRNLSINFDELEPAYYLRDSERVRQIEMESCQIRSSQTAGGRPTEQSELRVAAGLQMTAPAEEFEPATFPHHSQPPMPPLSFQDAPSASSAAFNRHHHQQQVFSAVSSSTAGLPPISMQQPPPMMPPPMTHQQQHLHQQLQLAMPPPQQPPSTAAAALTPSSTTSSNAGPSQQPAASAPVPYPRFKWTDIDTSRPLSAYFSINTGLHLLQSQPPLAGQARQTLEHTVNDLLEPVAQRCVRIVLATVEGIVRKDFALDDDENRLRAAAHNMARFLTAGMALITCREALSVNMETKLKQQFLAVISSPTPHQKEMMDEAAKMIASDNLELGTAYIQKVCVEKALAQVDVSLEMDYRSRILARQEGRRYYDAQQLAYHSGEAMPAQLRKTIGQPSPFSLAVYAEYADSVPGFASPAPPAAAAAAAAVSSTASSTTAAPSSLTATSAAAAVAQPAVPPPQRNEAAQLFDTIAAEVERQSQYIANSPSIGGSADSAAQLVQRLRVLIDRAQAARQTGNDASVHELVKAAVVSLFQTFKRQSLQSLYPREVLERYKDAHTVVLRLMYQPKISGLGFNSGCMSHVVTLIWTELNEIHKWNSDAFIELLKIHIVSLHSLDSHLAKQVRNNNLRAVRFVLDLFHSLVLSDNREQSVLNECDLTGTIAVLAQWLDKSPAGQAPEDAAVVCRQMRGLLDFGLLEAHQMPATVYLYSGCSQAREFDDPPWLQEISEGLMKKWYALYSTTQRMVDQRSFNGFVKEMTMLGILKTDDLITRFFRLTTDYVMEHCFRALLKSGQELLSNRISCYQELDAYIRLIAVMVKHSGEQAGEANREAAANTKLNLLNKILGIIAGTLLQEQDIRSDRFHPMPFQRIFVLLFSELLCPAEAVGQISPALASLTDQMLAAFANALHILECICHRTMLSKFLCSQAAWPMYAQLLIDLLKFIAPFLATANFIKTVQALYRGALRLILVLLHDFPDFVSEYHHALCDVIPANCIQLRNLVLSAFPKAVQLLDPIQSPAAQCYALPEMQLEPKGSFASLEASIPSQLRQEVDSFLATRKPVLFLTDLQSRIRLQQDDGGLVKYNTQLVNALVLYIGRRAVKRINETGNSLQPYNMTHCVATETLQALVMFCCTEGRYLLLNAMANQLRYPNSHTFYFNQVLLFFFRESNNEQIKEQITRCNTHPALIRRVLLERLIVLRPHPWGLLLTFTELLKNPSYRFWDHEFVRFSPQIEKVLESVARSCVPGFRMPPPPPLPHSLQQQQQQDPVDNEVLHSNRIIHIAANQI
uniref:CNOT1_HEAT domain-containing protein n=1 Tax=Macrostomum lignano TaxID=282301 RepID=A0A1I8HS60_9PLAT